MKKKQIVIAIISFEIFVLALLVYFVLPKPSLTTRVEAVNMNLSNYKFDYYVSTNVVKTGDVGTAKYTFEGIPAYYNLVIGYVDEDDGNSNYTVNVGGAEIGAWTADKNPKKDCLFTKTIENVKLSDDSEIKVIGTRNKGESARIAYIEIIYKHGITPISLFKYGFEQLARQMYTANLVFVIIISLIFLVLNITAFTILKPKKPVLAVQNDIPASDLPDTDCTAAIAEDMVESSEHAADNNNGLAANEDTTSVEVPLIDQMAEYLDNNYADGNFTVQQMADHFELSLNYISSFFKEQTGQNIIYYLTNLRIEKAKDLLTSSDLPIKNVAENSGYYNVSSFIRRFKKITGLTPGEFRLNSSSDFR